jgi:hypothetical protein
VSKEYTEDVRVEKEAMYMEKNIGYRTEKPKVK